MKRGLAEMLKGGVIMDVVDPEQAKIAEDAGACAVMALERVPADIRRDGGVARMSDPEMIEGIKAAVTIPVMAKARIGHFVEAQILEALGVDYIDESEVLTPADEAHHIDKWAFTAPFVCGATNLGEALRRISEGAAMIRSKGEAGTGNIVEAVRHLRSIIGDIRKIGVADSAELFDWAKRLQAPLPLVQEIAETGWLPVPLFCAGGVATPADAALVMQLGAEAVFVGSGIFKSETPAGRGQGHRRGHHPLPRRRHPGQGEPRPRQGHARPGGRHARREARRAGLVSADRRAERTAEAARWLVAGSSVGVLALQGAFAAHARVLAELRRDAGRGPHARTTSTRLDALVMPGGESTTMSMLLESSGLFDPLAERLADGLPVLGTCAGMILLATDVLDGRPDQRSFGAHRPRRAPQRLRPPGRLVRGRPATWPGSTRPFHAVFIRAPGRRAGRARGRGARRPRGPAGARCARAPSPSLSFHPELSGDPRLHQRFLQEVRV